MQGRALKKEHYVEVNAPVFKKRKRNRPIGSITERKSFDRMYKYIKTDSGWKLLHHHRWAEANGSIPKGHLVAFKNGDHFDCRLENLEMITRKEMMNRNRRVREYKSVVDLLNEGKRPAANGEWI